MHKVHFSLDKATYQARVANGTYKTEWGALSHQDIPKEYDVFQSHMMRVGHKWGWNAMTERFGRAAMDVKFSRPETVLRELMDGERVVGYALILKPAESLRTRFFAATGQSVIEIENLGLFPEECGGGRGWSFFEMQFKDLFETYDTVYWSMSSTNHPHLQAYYERQGMSVLAVDVAKPALVA